MYWNDGPRTWKWAVPAGIFIVLIPITGRMYTSTNSETQFWAMLPCGFGFLFLGIAFVNLWKLLTQHNQEMFAEHQAALSTTPLVLLAQNMKQMHPEAVRVLNRFGVRTSWQVRVSRNFGERDWVLADTNVHFGFIEFVLLRSSRVALYPKNRFSEGSKKWDPDGLVEDREQYDELEKWLFARMMVTRSFGPYRPAEFIPPFTPELVLETMGLTGEQDLYRPEETLKTKDLNVMPHVNGNGAKAPLSPAATSPQMVDRNLGGERELSDEELQAIQLENETYIESVYDKKGI